MATKTQFIDVLRLEPDEVTRILTRVYRRARRNAGDERRCERRQPYTGHTVVLVQIQYPSREVGSYRAVSWNISANGLGFLHGKFVFPGSVCRVLLRGSAGDIVTVRGQVVRCQHLEGRIHDVGMRFDGALDLGTVRLGGEEEEAEDGAPPTHADGEGGNDDA